MHIQEKLSFQSGGFSWRKLSSICHILPASSHRIWNPVYILGLKSVTTKTQIVDSVFFAEKAVPLSDKSQRCCECCWVSFSTERVLVDVASVIAWYESHRVVSMVSPRKQCDFSLWMYFDPNETFSSEETGLKNKFFYRMSAFRLVNELEANTAFMGCHLKYQYHIVLKNKFI